MSEEYEGHTPEPLFVHDFTDIADSIYVSCANPDHITVASMGKGLTGTYKEQLSNAKLFADSPKILRQRNEMFRLLKEIYEWTDYKQTEWAVSVEKILKDVDNQ